MGFFCVLFGVPVEKLFKTVQELCKGKARQTGISGDVCTDRGETVQNCAKFFESGGLLNKFLIQEGDARWGKR